MLVVIGVWRPGGYFLGDLCLVGFGGRPSIRTSQFPIGVVFREILLLSRSSLFISRGAFSRFLSYFGSRRPPSLPNHPATNNHPPPRHPSHPDSHWRCSSGRNSCLNIANQSDGGAWAAVGLRTSLLAASSFLGVFTHLWFLPFPFPTRPISISRRR